VVGSAGSRLSLIAKDSNSEASSLEEDHCIGDSVVEVGGVNLVVAGYRSSKVPALVFILFGCRN
jgi:hypothetical protein